MYEDILGKDEDRIIIYCPYIPLQITAVPRKLKVRWTLELKRELEEIYGIGKLERQNESTIKS